MKKYLIVFSLFLLCPLLMLPASSGAQPTLTGGIVYATDSSGGANKAMYWNTLGGDAVWNLYVKDSAGFINSGNGGGASLNYSLNPGIHTFSFHSQPNGTQNSDYLGLNLFLDTNNANPAISVFASRYDGGGYFPPFYANSNLNTRTLTGAGAPASGSLSYTSGNYIVTLTDYHVADWTVSPANLVGTFNNVPSGSNDFQGQFTLDVAVAPEPVSSTLFIVGGATLGFRRLRKKISNT